MNKLMKIRHLLRKQEDTTPVLPAPVTPQVYTATVGTAIRQPLPQGVWFDTK